MCSIYPHNTCVHVCSRLSWYVVYVNMHIYVYMCAEIETVVCTHSIYCVRYMQA